MSKYKWIIEVLLKRKQLHANRYALRLFAHDRLDGFEKGRRYRYRT